MFNVEIIRAVNGYLVLEGTNEYADRGSLRRKWVASTVEELGILVVRLAKEHEEKTVLNTTGGPYK